MRNLAKEMFGDRSDFIIGVNGSLARREYTSGSDVDLFFLVLNQEIDPIKEKQNDFRSRLCDIGIKMPASGGVFEEPLPSNDMLATIGGNDDTNIFITRRLLFLLEGDWIFNKESFDLTRKLLIERYVDEGIEDKKICLFLLNDIIRYWRTICVDYEYKVYGGGKAKAIRLIKLRFSRMLLYFAGVVAVGETKDLSYKDKRDKLNLLLSEPPIERLRSVIGDDFILPLQLYAEFLTALDDPEIRSQLDQVGDEGLSTEQYLLLSEKARSFKNTLLHILLTKLGTAHPVIKALLL
ncbi:hypothetical protein [Azorhizobium oxalatiphilum]|nr:hypothetical protein [Azorhizobium oxalatiphilum]